MKIAVHTGGLVKFLLEWIKKRRTGEVRFLAPPQRIFKLYIACVPAVRENSRDLGRHGATEERFESFSPHENKSAKVN